jgi:hypothetical protein
MYLLYLLWFCRILTVRLLLLYVLVIDFWCMLFVYFVALSSVVLTVLYSLLDVYT